MGGFLSNQSAIDEVTDRSNYFITERVAKIPANYQIQKDHIVHEMHKTSPEAFNGLYIKDYPEKNEKQVNKLAIHNVTSNEVKHQIVREVHGEVDPMVDEKTMNLNKIVRSATKKAIHVAIKKAVGAAVDAVQKKLERQFGVDSSKDEKISGK
ncbi:unnamed protein product [Rotaria sp. Silwood2]|nr:unnamed protein product [Rotaria sp. Silwood2]